MLTNHSHDKPGSHKHSSVESKRDLEAKALAKQTLDNERQADLLGMQWAIKAGYSACGSYRLAQGLEELKSGISSAVNLASHPTNNERMQIAQQFEHLENRSTNCMADTSENNFMISATETLYLHAVEDAIY
jgi:predicted Zn-dependent protease